MTAYMILQNIFRKHEYNEVGWLFLMSLAKWYKKRMRSGTQIPSSIVIINYLKASKYALKETLSSCRHRDKTAENQTQNLIL